MGGGVAVRRAVTVRRGSYCQTVQLRSDGGSVWAGGTDDRIVGWKEDFNLAFKKEVKAQKDALAYLGEAVKKAGEGVSSGLRKKTGLQTESFANI